MRDLSDKKRIVIKVGSSTLTHENGLMNLRRVERLVKVLADIKNSGREIILVSSGAMAVGVGKLGLSAKPGDMPGKQAVAAVGQCELMYIYDKLFSEYHHITSQILLTRDTVDHPERRSNAENTLRRLLEMRTLPIVNENDTVSTEEIEFGDNDTLSAIVSVLAGADLLVILSDIDGLYDKNPRDHTDAKLIPLVPAVTPDIEAAASGKGSARGTGGMSTKLSAAKIAAEGGVSMVIMNGENPDLLYSLLEGQEIGTLFPAPAKQPV